MVKAIFFDLDGVLTHNKNDFTFTWEIFARDHKFSSKKVFDCLKPYNHDIYHGQKKLQDIWPNSCICLGKDIGITTLEDIYNFDEGQNDISSLREYLRSLEVKVQ